MTFNNKKITLLFCGFGMLAVLGCGSSGVKKEETSPTSAPSVSAPSTAPATDVAPVETTSNNEAFVIPASAKKQAKYFPEGSPTRAIQDLDDMLDSYITNPQTDADREYNEKLKRAVLKGAFDIRELSRLALDKHWAERTPQEQDYFVNLMIRLLERKAIFSKEQGQNKTAETKKNDSVYKVNYDGHQMTSPDQTLALIKTTVNVPSQKLKIALQYRARKAGEKWNVYDVIVDEASLLENYKYQFDKIIAKEGYAGLVKRMEDRMSALEKKGVPEKVGEH